jgi:hypothetical protein
MVRWETVAKTPPLSKPLKEAVPAIAPLLDAPPRVNHGLPERTDQELSLSQPADQPPPWLMPNDERVSAALSPKNLAFPDNPPSLIAFSLSTPSWVPQNAYEYAYFSHFFIFIFTPIGYRGEE